MDFEELTETAQGVLDENGYADFTVMDDAVIECPCGHNIEWDGKCPEGCRSPMLALGII